jgi:predicted RNase H-like nuclease
MTNQAEWVLGVDGCRKGWVGVALGPDEFSTHFAPTIDQLVRDVSALVSLQVVAIDIPIGLPDNSSRECDVLARSNLGARASSVFSTPTRAAVHAPDQPTASRINMDLIGKGVAAQSFAIVGKIREVDLWAPTQHIRVVEVHPEVCFRHLKGAPLTAPKKTWNGAEERRVLLAQVGLAISGDQGALGREAAVDDVLDAAVAAWTARRVLEGAAISLPDPPELFSDGWPTAMWV